jgi:hypothetical protein
MRTDFKDVFGQSGPLARALPRYAYRPEQAAMANAVGAALARLDTLIVEAGTGTGKTFAYLIPALLSGRSVIISTGTRTLQDQLFRRDVPLLAKALGLPVKIALLKGRSNYLCRHRLELAAQQESLFDSERGAQRVLARISRWAASTKSGDLSELSDLPEQSPVWPSVTSTRENCLGQECAQFSRCHVFDARRNAQAADIVIVNHHLLLADLALKEEGFGDLLPGAEAVILDEAHQVPDIAAQLLGRVWSVRQVQLLLRDIGVELAACGARAPSLTAATDELMSGVDRLRSLFPRGGARFEWAALPDAFVDTLPEFESALSDIAAQLDGLGAGAGAANCARRAAQLAGDLAALPSARIFRILRQVSAWTRRAPSVSAAHSTMPRRRVSFCRPECPIRRTRHSRSASSKRAHHCSRRVAGGHSCCSPATGDWAKVCAPSTRVSPRPPFRSSYRAKRRARRCSRAFGNWAMQCCLRPAAFGRVWMSRATRCRSWRSTSCRSHRPMTRCSKRGWKESGAEAAILSSNVNCRRQCWR